MEFTASDNELICDIIKAIQMNEICDILERAYPESDEQFIKSKINQLADIIYRMEPDKFRKIDERRKAMLDATENKK